MSASHPRRAFLRGLATLPLIGGSVAIIGQPSASAAAPTRDVLEAYKAWLRQERHWLAWEMAGKPTWRAGYRPLEAWEQLGLDPQSRRAAMAATILGASFNVGNVLSWHNEETPPSTRAAVILAAAGFDPMARPSAIDWPAS